MTGAPRPKRRLVDKAPIEAMEGASPARLRPVALSIALTAMVMLLLGSKALYNWASALPVNPVSDALLDLTGAWQDWMDGTGLTRFAATVRNWLAVFRGR